LNNLTVIIPVSSVPNSFAKLFTIIANQLTDTDQLIIANYGMNKSTLDKDFFPDMSKVIYFEHECSESKILNLSLLHFTINNNVLIIDPFSLPNSNIIEKIRQKISPDIIQECNSIYDGESVNIPINIQFNLEKALEARLFNEKYDNKTYIHFKDFINKLKELNCKSIINDNAILQYFSLKHIRSSKMIIKDDKFVNIVSELDKNATIIIPTKSHSNFDKFLNLRVKSRQDKIIKLEPTSSRIASVFFNTIKSSSNDCIIILNSLDKTYRYNIINVFKQYYDENKILIDNANSNQIQYVNYNNLLTQVNTSKINGYTSVCFSKKILDGKSADIAGDIPTLIKSIALKADKEIYMINSIISKGRNTTYVISGIDKNNEKKSKQLRQRFPKITPPSKRGKSIEDVPQYNNITELPKPNLMNKKPKIVFVCDVEGWAWWLKSKYLKKYLEEYYKIDIVCLYGNNRQPLDRNKYDLYFTYGHSFIDKLSSIPFNKRITGVTAHRPDSLLEPQMKKAAVIHANSVLLYNIVKKYHNLVYYVPNGVDHKLFRPVKPILEKRDNIIVGHVGKLSPRKGQQDYIIPAIQKAGADKLLHLNNYQDKISHDKMYEIYQALEVFIVASSEDGTPNPALEAAACGRPIISNKIGNMPELIIDGYNGFIVEKEINAYVEKIKYLRKNRDKLIEMGNNVRKSIEETWTWDLMYKNYIYMFDQILGINRDPEVYRNPAMKHIGLEL